MANQAPRHLDEADVEALSRSAVGEMGLDRWPLARGGSVFADLRLDDPEVHLLKASLVVELGELILAGRVERAAAAGALEVGDKTLDRVLRGDHAGRPLDVVVRGLAALGYRVQPRVLTIPPDEGADDQEA